MPTATLFPASPKSKQGQLIDLCGQRFGMLSVLSRAENDKGGKAMWLCACDCGDGAIVAGTYLRAGARTSCGKHRTTAQAKSSHGRPTHGLSGTAEHRTWVSMRNRCISPTAAAYHDYGGRGIKVCERWNSFEAFSADMGPRPSPAHSIDRINNDGDYEPENCRWTTNVEQMRNRRRTRYVRHNGMVATIPEMAGALGISRSALHHMAARRQKGFEFVPRQSPTPIHLASPYHTHLTCCCV